MVNIYVEVLFNVISPKILGSISMTSNKKKQNEYTFSLPTVCSKKQRNIAPQESIGSNVDIPVTQVIW